MLGLIVIACAIAFIVHLVKPRNFDATGSEIVLHLKGGDFKCPWFPPSKKSTAKGIVVLGTGDGGWSYWEDNTAQALAANGYAVIGWDCRDFADSRFYDHSDLVDGFHSAADSAQSQLGTPGLPLWYGGWSTGAEQSVAAAGSPDRPKPLMGLLLAAPGERGRYGISTSDLLGVTPTGDDTFALADFASQLDGLHVAQFAAGLDPMDHTDWLTELRTPHKIFELPGCLHDMGGAGEEFQAKLREAIRWSRSEKDATSVKDSRLERVRE